MNGNGGLILFGPIDHPIKSISNTANSSRRNRISAYNLRGGVETAGQPPGNKRYRRQKQILPYLAILGHYWSIIGSSFGRWRSKADWTSAQSIGSSTGSTAARKPANSSEHLSVQFGSATASSAPTSVSWRSASASSRASSSSHPSGHLPPGQPLSKRLGLGLEVGLQEVEYSHPECRVELKQSVIGGWILGAMVAGVALGSVGPAVTRPTQDLHLVEIGLILIIVSAAREGQLRTLADRLSEHDGTRAESGTELAHRLVQLLKRRDYLSF